MSKSRSVWPDHWRRGPSLSGRIKNKRYGGRLIVGAALLSLTGALAMQFMGAPVGGAAKPDVGAALMTAAPAVSMASASAVSPQEQALWDNVILARSRQGFEDYQKAFPAGLYAAKAQEMLSTCRMQTRQRWKANPRGVAQSGRGEVASPAGADQTQACATARSAALLQAQQSCGAANPGIGPSADVRNSVNVTSEAACACSPAEAGGALCVAELQTACRWEERVTRTVEVCGG